jgi:thioredoxin-like negative regulator of GroEL
MPSGIAPLALAALMLFIGTNTTNAQGMTAAEALQTVKKTGKPLLAVASSPTCGPCLRLKSVIHSDPKVKSILDDFVYLEMDSKSAEFAQFRASYPGSYSGVPMVYMLRADGEVMYGQSGGMPTEQLQMLLNHGLKNAGTVLSATELQRVEQAFGKGRALAEEGDLADAYSLMSQIANLGSFADVVYSAQETQQELNNLIANWTTELDQSIAAGESVHANAYRLAELYVELPESATVLRANIKHVLDHYEAQDRTGNAIRQNKRLVRARLEESREMCDAAVASYQYVIGLGVSSPAGAFAKERLAVVAKKQKLKFSTNN